MKDGRFCAGIWQFTLMGLELNTQLRFTEIIENPDRERDACEQILTSFLVILLAQRVCQVYP